MLVADSPHWVIAREMNDVARIASGIGIQVVPSALLKCTSRQSVFFGSHFQFLAGDWIERPHRFAVTYFHGRPGSGDPVFDRAYRRLTEVHHRIDRLQVSHSEMHDVVLSSGIDPAKVFVIPIGINLDPFAVQTPQLQRAAREALGIPLTATVVGSFQKDGVGWGAGLEPKLVKGPDVLLDVLERVKSSVPELVVLLSGPARGYVKAGLQRLGIPFHHACVGDYADMARLYHALDAYLVTARQEGGPKAVLESMASGVPLVTTRVGQAMDLVEHGRTGWMAAPGDVDALAHWTRHALTCGSDAARMRPAARRVAEANSYDAQIPLWRRFMTGFVASAPAAGVAA